MSNNRGKRLTSINYLALLRGVNVGGNNIIRMTDLKGCFEDMGCEEVVTYIQSGNVVFRSEAKDAAKLVTGIEQALSTRFAYSSTVVLLTDKQLTQVVEQAPDKFGEEPDEYRYDVIFLKKPLTSTAAMKSVSMKPGVDAVHKGKDALYFSRLISKAAQSHLSKLVTLPVYKQMTIRNWNTTTKLLALMDKLKK